MSLNSLGNMIFLRLVLLLTSCRLSCASKFRPVVIMHGLTHNEHSYNRNIAAIEAAFPGIYVKALPVYDDASSIYTPMETQLAGVIDAIRADKNLSAGFNFYGESQGALLARTYVSTCNDPPVYNLVALNGPQNGVGECPKVELQPFKEWCGDLGTDLDIYEWPFCSFCDYWRGKNKEDYMEKSRWLAKVNNDRFDQPGGYNATYRHNMIGLNKYMVTFAEQDTMVQPPQSAWHTYWFWGQRQEVMKLEETEPYIHDVLGLKTLNERGDFVRNSFNGNHVQYNMSWWNANILHMFDNRLPSINM